MSDSVAYKDLRSGEPAAAASAVTAVVTDEGDLGIIRDLLHKDGERWTHQRRAIVSTLLAATEHPTSDELTVLAKRADPTIAQATVYRTLAILVAVGVARRVAMDGGPARFEIMLGRRDHHHLIDVVHHSVLEVDCSELDTALENLARKHGRQLVSRSLDIFVKPVAVSRSGPA